MAPKLAIGDGAMGFWKAVTKLWPETDQQRCWVHKTANVLVKLPKAMQHKVKEALHNIWHAETRKEAYKTFDDCIERFSPKYPSAMDCLTKDKDSMLAFLIILQKTNSTSEPKTRLNPYLLLSDSELQKQKIVRAKNQH